MQQDSETFRPVSAQLGNDDNYYSPVLLRETSTSRLYRISKAGRHFLIKTCLDTSASALVLLKREYEISLSLQHHHIPYIYTYEAQSPVGPGIVMEYVEGRSLVDYIKETYHYHSDRVSKALEELTEEDRKFVEAFSNITSE